MNLIAYTNLPSTNFYHLGKYHRAIFIVLCHRKFNVVKDNLMDKFTVDTQKLHESHTNAAKHFQQAAEKHSEAAVHYKAGQQDKGDAAAHQAQGQSTHAKKCASDACQHSAGISKVTPSKV